MILVFGSINADLFVNVNNLPQPGETVLCPTYTFRPGGKGANQAAIAARLGAEVKFIGAVGNDVFGKPVLAALGKAGVGIDDVKVVGETTGTAFVLVEESGENQIVVASGANLETVSHQVKDEDLTDETVLVLQMEVPIKQIEQVIFRASEIGSKIILNYAPAARIERAALELCDVLILNKLEADALSGEEKKPEDHVKEFAETYNCECVVTLGKNGSVLANSSGLYSIAALQITPVDTVGAGDVFVGAFAVSLLNGSDSLKALHRATIAGGLACTVEGAQPNSITSSLIDEKINLVDVPKKLGKTEVDT